MVDPLTPRAVRQKEIAPEQKVAQDDLYNMIFGDEPVKPNPTQTKSPLSLLNDISAKKEAHVQNMDDIFGSINEQINPSKTYQCFKKNNLIIQLITQPKSSNQTFLDIEATFTNQGQSQITGITLQVAVPKTLKLLMQPASNKNVNVGASETQLMRVENPSKVGIS